MSITSAQFEEMKRRVLPKGKAGSSSELIIVIPGQIRGGKNNMVVTRTGLHFPKPEWAKWRDEAVSGVKHQIPIGFEPISQPVDMTLYYCAGDRRRRDMPAILDSIFHVLEKAGVVKDDTLLWVTHSWRGYDKKEPKASICINLPQHQEEIGHD
jgi:Holliday junction resolvase RusA-like endonuclease